MKPPPDASSVELPSYDPWDGDPSEFEAMASALVTREDHATEVRIGVSALLNDPALGRWMGKSADAFRETLSPLPGLLNPLGHAYFQAAAALRTYAGKLRDGQASFAKLQTSLQSLVTANPANADGRAGAASALAMHANQASREHDQAKQACAKEISAADLDVRRVRTALSDKRFSDFNATFTSSGGNLADLLSLQNMGGDLYTAQLGSIKATLNSQPGGLPPEVLRAQIQDFLNEFGDVPQAWGGLGPLLGQIPGYLDKNDKLPNGSLSPEDQALLTTLGLATAKAAAAGYLTSLLSTTNGANLAGLIRIAGAAGDGKIFGTGSGAQFLSDLGTKILTISTNGDETWLSTGSPDVTPFWTDEASTVFNLVAQNRDASIRLVTGSQGAANAQALVLIEACLGHSVNPTIASDGIPQIIVNATSAGDSDKNCIEAAANIINGLGSDPERFPPDMTKALATMSMAFTSDLAASANHPVTSISVPNDDNPGQVDALTHVTADGKNLYVSVSSLATLYGEIGHNKDAVAAVNAAIAGQAFHAVNSQGVNAQSVLANLQALQTKVVIGQQNVSIGDAAAKDQVNSDMQMWIGAVLGGFGNSSLPDGLGFSGSQVAAGGLGAPLLSELFPTNHASTAEAQAQMTLSGTYTMLDVATTQGLLSRGVIPASDLPTNCPWMVNGVIHIHNPNEQSDFEMWLSREQDVPENFDSLDPATRKQIQQRVDALNQLYLNTRTGAFTADGKFGTS